MVFFDMFLKMEGWATGLAIHAQGPIDAIKFFVLGPLQDMAGFRQSLHAFVFMAVGILISAGWELRPNEGAVHAHEE